MSIYKLIFKQLQPIHIGAGSYGVISETRIFIPGWTMWGALTKAYNLQNGKDLSANQNLFENISCFYPSFDKEGKNVLFPKFESGSFYLGGYSEKEFRAKFVDTNISTAILPLYRAAKDESLHETDVILPGVKKEYRQNSKEDQLYWIGIVKLETDISSLKSGLKIYIGGDVKYGLGLMELIDAIKVIEENKDIENFIISNYISIQKTNIEKLSAIELLVKAKGYKEAKLQIDKKGFYFIPNINIKKEMDNIKNLFPNKGIIDFETNSNNI